MKNQTPQQRIVVTGMGCVTPLGNDVPTFWSRLIAAQSGIEELGTVALQNKTGGEVKDFDWELYGEEGDCDEASQFAFAATHEAIADAHLSDFDLRETGIAFLTAFNGDAVREYAADYVAKLLAIEGPRVTLSDVHSSGISAIGLASDWLRSGRASRVLCGGYDSLSLSSPTVLSALSMISPDLCRPFDRNRNGTLFGEGAAVLVLETWEEAERRNAKVYAELLGWAENNNTHHLTASDKNCLEKGEELEAVMRAALQNARISADEIDYICAHGIGTQQDDLAETQAIKRLLSDRASSVPVSSIKAATSHIMSGAGVLKAIATVLAMQNQTLPPTLNYQTPDPECDLDYVPNTARETKVLTALSNSSGINGKNNGCVALRVV